jgi:hypothetical protein
MLKPVLKSELKPVLVLVLELKSVLTTSVFLHSSSLIVQTDDPFLFMSDTRIVLTRVFDNSLA